MTGACNWNSVNSQGNPTAISAANKFGLRCNVRCIVQPRAAITRATPVSTSAGMPSTAATTSAIRAVGTPIRSA